MTIIKNIFEKIIISYDGIELNKIDVLKKYGEFCCDILDSPETNKSALLLHTGSIYYKVMLIAIVSIECLCYNNTDIFEMINTLEKGDILIRNGERVRFLEIKDKAETGEKYLVLEEKNDLKRSIPLCNIDRLKSLSLYRGESQQLGGRGARNAILKNRKEFISFFTSTQTSKISTMINKSMAILLDRETSEKIFKKTYIFYDDKRIRLNDLITASYYSENENYQIGENSHKEEAIIRFYSNISSCRKDIIRDKKNRILGFIALDENLWLDNCEIYDITNRNSIRVAFILGKIHYIKYMDWVKDEKNKVIAYVPEYLSQFKSEAICLTSRAFADEIHFLSERNILEFYLDLQIDEKLYYELIQKLDKIRKDSFSSDKKDKFLFSSYFILSICRSAIFPLSYLNKAYEKHLLSWTLQERLASIKAYILSEEQRNKNDLMFVLDILKKMIDEIWDLNPKGEYLKECILDHKVDCIIVPKSYYEKVFFLWLEERGISENLRPEIITNSLFEKSKSIYKNAIFVTSFYDYPFNCYASCGYQSGNMLLYNFEKSRVKYLKYISEKGKKLIDEKNNLKYISFETQDKGTYDDSIGFEQCFEEEMRFAMNAFQRKNAYQLLDSSKNKGNKFAKISKIIIFSSGKIGFFTKYYNGYCINGSDVSEVDVMNLKIGDRMIFTNEEENRDIVDILLKKSLEEQLRATKFPEYYWLSTMWKEKLKKYMRENDCTFQDVSIRLEKMGSKKHQVTIRTWLDDDAHIVGPREEKDFKAIVKMIGINENPMIIKEACDKIRRLRTKILEKIGEIIFRRMFTEQKGILWKAIAEKVEKLVQLEQISDIFEPLEKKEVPIYMINKLCD